MWGVASSEALASRLHGRPAVQPTANDLWIHPRHCSPGVVGVKGNDIKAPTTEAGAKLVLSKS